MKTQRARFAAGCFWGPQYYFDQVPGVVQTTVGYSGGTVPRPTYDAVTSGRTGHAETVEVTFDPKKISYQDVLRHFFRLHDPTQVNRQGPDVGTQYRSIVFYFDEHQHADALQIRNESQQKLERPIATELIPAMPFYEAEGYHQKFTQRTGIGMCHIPYEALK